MIVAAAGELQGAVPQPSSLWPLFQGFERIELGIRDAFPTFQELKKQNFQLGFCCIFFWNKKKICVSIKHSLEEWIKNGRLEEECCPHS